MAKWIVRLLCLFLSVVSSLIILPSFAKSNSLSNIQSAQLGQATVCRFIDQQFSRPIRSYVHDYGPILSSETYPLGKDAKVIATRLAQQISVSYLVAEREPRESVTNVEAKGIEAWRKLGLEIQSVGDVRSVFGEPDRIEGQAMLYYGYGCDKSPNSILQIDSNGEILSIHEIDSAN